MPISLDHQAYLGDRVELIAAEKAGIMKRGCPVVIGQQEDQTAPRRADCRSAERLDCPVSVYGQDFMAHEEFGRLIYQDEFGLMDLPLPRLPGRHQYRQCRCRHRRDQGGGFRIGHRAAEKAMASVKWPGRLQRLPAGQLVGACAGGRRNLGRWRAQSRRRDVIAEAMAEQEERCRVRCF